jgi:hypothetical protein
MAKSPQLENMKRTAEQLYEYETKRIEQYLYKLDAIFKTYMLPEDVRHELKTLIEWYGHARAIKSKAYQEMKANKKL